MKILLFGEYSNLHWTLSEGLRSLGHEVIVASDGDGFKNNQRDIDLLRRSSGIKDTLDTLVSVYKNLDNLKGYDIVQLINPCFTTLNVEVNRRLYRFLKRHNEKIFLGAFGDDAYWLKACLGQEAYRYSEFYANGRENHIEQNQVLKKIWNVNSSRARLNAEIAESCDGIVACLYEYFVAYKPYFDRKLSFIPLPINLQKIEKTKIGLSDKINFFVGINKARSQFKGTDRLYSVLQEVKRKYPSLVKINSVESVTYEEYIKIITDSDVVLDQLYSYSPAMNGLLSLAMGKVLISGGEPEMYELLGEYTNRPIINVLPQEDDMFNKLENLVLNKESISEISDQGRLFVEKHHDHIKVAQQYLEFWTR